MTEQRMQRTQRRRGLGSRVLETCALSVAWIGGWVGIAQAMPVLSELYYDAPGSDDGFGFVEVAGIPGTSLEGLSIEGVNGRNGAIGPNIVLTGSIGASGLFVVADQTSAGTSGVPGADLFANFDFQNGPDSVVLRFGDTILDQLGYGDFAMNEVFAGEGMAAPDVAPGQSLARFFADLDTDNNVMDFAVSDIPTPGIASFLPIPEPGGAILLGLGLAGLGFRTRRCGSRPRR